MADHRPPSAGDTQADVSRRAGRDHARALIEIGQALGSTLDLDALLQAVMRTTTEALGAERSSLFLVDETTGELWSRVAQGTGVAEIRLPRGTGIAGWVAETGRALRIEDAYEDRRFNREVDRLTGFRTTSVLCAPVRDREGKVRGVVQVLDGRQALFDERDEELLAGIASQVAVALHNAQLYRAVVRQNAELVQAQTRLKEALAELDVLHDIERRISNAEGLDALLDQIVGRARALCGAEAGSAVVLEGHGGRLLYQGPGPGGDLARQQRSLGAGLAAFLAESREPVVANDLRDRPSEVPVATQVLGVRPRSALCVPVLADSEVLGALELLDKRGAGFGEADVRLLTLVAGQTARAIHVGRGREEKERRLRLAAVGQMLSSLMHDLKTPMTVVSGYAELMATDPDPASRQRTAELVCRQVAQVEAMAREILQFARGDRALLPTRVYLHQFLAEVEQDLRREFTGRNVQLEVRAGYKGLARFDESKIRRVVSNLARNAVEAMPGGGRFEIGVERREDGLELTFADTGPGIPPEIEGHLFESFVGRREGGTGLGLAIVKKAVEDHGGTITCTSAPGRGTTFVVRLPQA